MWKDESILLDIDTTRPRHKKKDSTPGFADLEANRHLFAPV